MLVGGISVECKLQIRHSVLVAAPPGERKEKEDEKVGENDDDNDEKKKIPLEEVRQETAYT